MVEIRCFEPVIDNQAKLLIVGSMPGEKSLKQNQYYANQRNHFWKIIYSLFDAVPDENYKKRLSFLQEKGIALWDVIQSCQRTGSLDSNIRREKVNDFIGLLEQYPDIGCIVFNGAKAYDTFKKYIGLDLKRPVLLKKMPSTSPTPGRIIKTYEQKLEQWSFVKDYLS